MYTSRTIRIIQLDIDGPTDKALTNVKKNLHTTSISEAVRRSISIAKFFTSTINDGNIIIAVDKEGTKRRIVTM